MNGNLNYLYFHINPLKNEIFYVGIGNKFRPYRKARRSKLWHNTVNKYGYIVDVSLDNLSWEQACKLEKDYIKRIGRKDLGLGTLVNHTNGGDGANGVIITEEYREKLRRGQSKRAARSKESCIKISNSLKNLSPEVKKKVSDCHKKSIIQLDLSGNFIKEWCGAIDIQNDLGISRSAVCFCCKGKTKTSGGFIWKYK